MYGSGPKKPPPAHGIKIDKPGTTWWGKRWIEALEHVLGGDAGRLGRGRTYARAGRTHDLTVSGGEVHAKVTGSRDAPYDIEIRLSRLSDEAWKKAIAQMAEKAQFAAELLAGQMPRDIDAAFRAADASLFPRTRKELVTECSCPDWGDPCKHVAATHYVLGDVLDRDPFLLFELRGRTKVEVLDALRAARGGGTSAQGKGKRGGARSGTAGDAVVPAGEPREASEPRRVTPGKSELAEYDRPREALPSLHFSFDAPAVPAAVLRQLGAPAAWSGKKSPAEALAPLVQRAAEAARRRALGEGEGAANDVALATPSEKKRRTKSRRRGSKS